jgi:hypothetical protein
VIDVMDPTCWPEPPGTSGCAGVPVLERLSYFFGQMLEPVDFIAEQDYFANRLSLLTRYGVGWGVACGLDVELTPANPPPCDGRPEIECLMLTAGPGIAFDCCGRIIVLRRSLCVRLWPLLDQEGRDALRKGEELHVSIEHADVPAIPVRGLDDSGCDPFSAVQYGRFREESRIRVGVRRPANDECDGCLAPCADPAVLLAGIRVRFEEGKMLTTVRSQLRRLLGRFRLAEICGLGWVHGGTYRAGAAAAMLGSGVGLRFTRPVRVATLQPGVADLVVYEGGSGRRDTWYVKGVDLVVPDAAAEFTEQVTVRVQQPEGVQIGDRIRLSLRADFVLDSCCRALSGAHRGGGVMLDPGLSDPGIEHPAPNPLACPHPPERQGPWHSGNGCEGGTFDTWIYVGPDQPASSAPAPAPAP